MIVVLFYMKMVNRPCLLPQNYNNCMFFLGPEENKIQHTGGQNGGEVSRFPDVSKVAHRLRAALNTESLGEIFFFLR